MSDYFGIVTVGGSDLNAVVLFADADAPYVRLKVQDSKQDIRITFTPDELQELLSMLGRPPLSSPEYTALLERMTKLERAIEAMDNSLSSRITLLSGRVIDLRVRVDVMERAQL